MITLRTGDTAYFGTVRDGLIASKVVSVGQWTVKLRLTASRGCYERGEIVDTTYMHAIPRPAVRRGRYATYIRPFTTIADGTAPA